MQILIPLLKKLCGPYLVWILQHEPSRREQKKMAETCRTWPYQPKISIVTPVYNPAPRHLIACIRSVLAQIYPHWELCLVDGNSQNPKIKKILKRFAKQDPRIKVQFLSDNLGIAENTNACLKQATGEFIAFLDHDDTLAPFALYEVVRKLGEDRTLEILYSDEDSVSPTLGIRSDPHFKPNFSPHTLRSYNYICHLFVIRKILLERLGVLENRYDGAQDYDLVLRSIEASQRIAHLPKILYHWRKAEQSASRDAATMSAAFAAGAQALTQHLQRAGYHATVNTDLSLGAYTITYLPPQEAPPVFLITHPTENSLEKALNKSGHPIATQAILTEPTHHAVHTFNQLIATHPETYIMLLHSGIEMTSENWLHKLVGTICQSNVACAGGKVTTREGIICHAGFALSTQAGKASCQPLYAGFPKEHPGYKNRLKIAGNVSAFDDQLIVFNREALQALGPFDTAFPLPFAVIDMCLRAKDAGYDVVYLPYVEGIHTAPETRCPIHFGEVPVIFQKKWAHVLKFPDPYYPPPLFSLVHPC